MINLDEKNDTQPLNNFVQIKAVIIDENLKVVNTEHVIFDQDLKEYRTQYGVHKGENGRVTAPTIMWVKALDLLMEKIRIQGVDLSKVAAISAAGQVPL